MRALAIAALWGAALGGLACAGDVSTPGDDGSLAAEAQALFESQVEPSLAETCASCHDDESVTWNWFSPSPDRYSAIKSRSHLMDLESPSSSLLLNKGVHSGGPALTRDQYNLTLEWIRLESEVAGIVPDEVIETPVVQPVPGLNTVPLDATGLPGSTLEFDYQALASGIYLTNLKVTAGDGGATVTHPLLVTWEDDTPTPDPIDRFSQVELSLAGGETGMIGGGVAAITNVSPKAALSVHFRSVEPTGGAGGGGPDGGLPGGCVDVAAFSANAAPALDASCTSCHGGANASATAALDLSQLGVDDAQACGQTLSRVNLADPPNSPLFIAPNPAVGGNHPFQFGGNQANFDAFAAAVTPWIDAENAQ